MLVVLMDVVGDRIPLTRWACVDRVEAIQRICHGVGLVELERVVRLRLDIDADDLEACPRVANGSPAGPAEQVQEAGLHGATIHSSAPKATTNATRTAASAYRRGSMRARRISRWVTRSISPNCRVATHEYGLGSSRAGKRRWE